MAANEDDDARAAWRALKEAGAANEQLRYALGQLAVSRDVGEQALRDALLQLGGRVDAPPVFTTLVAGGHIDRLVNIARADVVHIASQPKPTSLFGLPRDIADFTGRDDEVDELVRLLGRADGDDPSVVISALSGKPGVGKSALAIHVAHRLRGRYPDAQLYVNLRGAEPEGLDPCAVLAGFLEDLGLAGDDIPRDLDRRASVFRAQLANRRALIVLDNAADELQVRPLLPGLATSSVIVTSRSPMNALEGARLRRVEILDGPPAVELLGKLAGGERVGAEPEQAEEIVKLCGRLPLAVRISGGLLAREPTWTVARLARRLGDEYRRLDELRLGDLEVRASFALSYDVLDDDAARVFRRVTALNGPDFGAGVACAADDNEPEIVERALERLVFAQMLETPNQDRYRFHDLIGDFARERARIEDSQDLREAAAVRGRQWYVQQLRLADAVLGSAQRPPSSSELGAEGGRAQRLAWLTLERANLVAATEQAHAAEDWLMTDELAARLLRAC